MIFLEDAFSIFVLESFEWESATCSGGEIEDSCFLEEILHFESETPRIPYSGTSHSPRKSYPRDKGGYTIVLVELHCEDGTEFSAIDSYELLAVFIIGLTVSAISISDNDTLIGIECKKAICTRGEEKNRYSFFLREPSNLWEEEYIIYRLEFEIISSSCMCLEGRKK